MMKRIWNIIGCILERERERERERGREREREILYFKPDFINYTVGNVRFKILSFSTRW